MKRILGNPLVGTLFRVILAFVFLYAGGVKLIEDHGARDAIMAYRLIPPSFAPVLGYVLPLVEIGLGLLLLVGLFIKEAGLASAIIMFLFIIGIASVWIRGYSIDCGCFGGGGDISPEGRSARYATEIVRDAVFTLMGFWLYRWPSTLVALEK